MVKVLVYLGYEVWGLSRREDFGNLACKIIAADLSKPDTLKSAIQICRPSHVIHLAGLSFIGCHPSVDFYHANLIGTHHLLEALDRYANSLASVLLASSASVYGNAGDGLISETSVCRPNNDYAVSKLAMENMAKLWLPKLPVVIARPFNYTGIGQAESFLIPKIVASFNAKEPAIELGNLDVWREFNDVRDVAYAYTQLLDAAPIGQTINVCSGRLISLREVIKTATEISNHVLRVQASTEHARSNELIYLGGDPSLLKHYLPTWQPRPFDQTLRWMLSEHADSNNQFQ